MVKNLPCNVGDMGSILGHRTKVPHAVEQLNLRAKIRESTRESVHCIVTSARSNKATTKTQRSQKNEDCSTSNMLLTVMSRSCQMGP